MSIKLNSLAGLTAVVALTFGIAACGAPATDEAVEETGTELSLRTAHFETFVGFDDRAYFDLVAANGRNVLRSQGYSTLSSAKRGVGSVLQHGADSASYRVEQAANGDWYFNLVASNGETIGTSELYASKSNATRAVESVRSAIEVLDTPVTVAAPKAQRFEVFAGNDGQTYFRLRAGNGEIVLSSEGYSSKSNALNGVAVVEERGVDVASYYLVDVGDGAYTIELVAANGEVVAQGEVYASKANANRAVNRIAEALSAGETEIKQ